MQTLLTEHVELRIWMQRGVEVVGGQLSVTLRQVCKATVRIRCAASML